MNLDDFDTLMEGKIIDDEDEEVFPLELRRKF